MALNNKKTKFANSTPLIVYIKKWSNLKSVIVAFLVYFIGVIDGYADEKTLFERQIQEKTDIIDRLEQELLCAGNRLQELEAEQQQIQEERELLSRQKEAMKAEAGPVEQRMYF